MGSFDDHVRYGVAFYVAAVLFVCVPLAYLLGDGVLDNGTVPLIVAAAVFGFPFALTGASFPDVDHHSAKPHRFFRKWISVAAAVVSGYVLFASGTALEAGTVAAEAADVAVEAPDPVFSGGVAAVGAVTAGIGAFVGVGVLKPRHRGVTHTLRAGLVVSAVVGVGFGYGASVVAPSAVGVLLPGGVAASAFFVGFLSHLQCDGLLVGFLPDAMG